MKALLLDVNVLLGLAVRRQGRLVTFDRRIVPNLVPGATDQHLVSLSR